MAPRTMPPWYVSAPADELAPGAFDIDAIVGEIAADPTYDELPCYVSLDDEGGDPGPFGGDDDL